MGTNQDIHLTLLQLFQNASGILGSAGTAQIFQGNREPLQSMLEGLVMLIGKHRGRHQHSHLLSITGRLEGSADGNFRLTESHISTHQTVHRPTAFHVFLHVSRSLALVGRIFIKE